MDYFDVFKLVLLGFFGILCIIEDCKNRKVSNYIVFLFMALGLVIFVISFILSSFNYFFILGLILSLLFSFTLYYFKLWGAADGKIFLSISLILMTFGHLEILLEYIVNLVFLYSITMVVLTQLKTSFKVKWSALKKIDFFQEMFLLFCIFTLSYLISLVFNLERDILAIFTYFIVVMIIMNFYIKYLKKFYKNTDLNLIAVFGFSMFVFLLFLGGWIFLIVFFIIFLIKYFIKYISNLSNRIYVNKKQYYSPFTVYLFFCSFLTIFIQASIINVLVIYFL